MHKIKHPHLLLLCLVMIAIAIMTVATACGSMGCALTADSNDILLQLRLPRVLAAFAVGGLLALAGALLQLLLRNPLADPYVLGLSGGAAAGAMLFTVLMPVAWAAYSLQLGALCGAGLATLLLFILARGVLLRQVSLASTSSGIKLILIGVMISSACGAVITLMLSLLPDQQLRSMVFWLMGDLESVEWIWPAWLILLFSLVWAWRHATALNILAHGEVTAQLLGLPVRRLRIMILLVASVATAAAVTVAGAIGFIGLVVPHALRLVMGNNQHHLLPASVLVGGIALTLADLFARTIVAPLQLPVGVITALIGVPVFLILLVRSR
jgi:iron complex transport system permease protein